MANKFFNEGRFNMNPIDTIRLIADDCSLLTAADVYRDDDLSGQCVGVRFVFADREVFIYPEGADDTICVSLASPAALADDSVRRAPMPTEWAAATGRPILWAWAMTNTQGRVDGIQIEFGTIKHPSMYATDIGSSLDPGVAGILGLYGSI